MSRTEWSVVSGQWSVTGGQLGDCPNFGGDCPNFRVSENGTVAPGVAHSRPGRVLPPSPFRLPPSRPVARAGFTLVEMLVTIAIIAIMAGLVFGALQAARATAREAATKATIAKLNNIIMARYESYLTRRIPLSTQGLSATAAAKLRLYAIRDLMRMEMPDRVEDVTDDPIQITADGKTFQMRRPALSQLYNDRLDKSPPGAGTGIENGQAELLYMIVSMGSPEAMEQFSQSEIGDTNKNGYPEFLDGWGRPIFFLRWAPGFSSYSAIQSDNAVTNHDPFDPLRTESNAYRLLPLIYSGGKNSDPGLKVGEGYHFGDTDNPGSMFSGANLNAFLEIGTPQGAFGKSDITNHQIEQR